MLHLWSVPLFDVARSGMIDHHEDAWKEIRPRMSVYSASSSECGEDESAAQLWIQHAAAMAES